MPESRDRIQPSGVLASFLFPSFREQEARLKPDEPACRHVSLLVEGVVDFFTFGFHPPETHSLELLAFAPLDPPCCG